MKVRALQNGYYNHLRRREGDVFELVPIKGHKRIRNEDTGQEKLVEHLFTPEEQFSTRWMEKVAKNTPTKVSTAQQSLNEVQRNLKSGRIGPSEAMDEVI